MDMDQRDVKFEERYKIRMDRQMNEVEKLGDGYGQN